jgi:hypothetical protein
MCSTGWFKVNRNRLALKSLHGFEPHKSSDSTTCMPIYCSRTLQWVRTSVTPPFSVGKGNNFTFLVWPCRERRRPSVRACPYSAWGRTLWPSQISPVSPCRDSYGILHENQTTLSFDYRNSNFMLTNLRSTSKPSLTLCGDFVPIENLLKF